MEAWDFELPPGDPRLKRLHDGHRETIPAHANLSGAAMAWAQCPDHMDFLAPDSPIRAQKALELGLYLDRWRHLIKPGCRVLDLGGGIGRFTQWCLDQGCDVELVDPDLRSLRCAVSHAIGRPGRLDVHWATGETLPDLAPVDVCIAAEVLCYVEDPARVLANIRRVLRGPLLCSVESRYGWALVHDAPAGALQTLLGDGILYLPGDRWVRTCTREEFAALLADWDVEEIVPTHYATSGPLEDVAGPLSSADLRRWEDRLRAHPVLSHLNRAWLAVAR